MIFLINVIVLFHTEKFQVEQLQRYENATQDHKKRQDQLYQKISLNRTQQAELRKKLFKLEEDEKKMENEKTFQQEVQRRATKVVASFNIFLSFS